MSQGVSSVGSCMAFSLVLPADETIEAQYDALTWVDWDEVTTLGDIGAVADVLTYNTVCNGIVQKRPGPVNNGSQSIEAAFDSSNPAQIMVKTAQKTRAKIACRETLSSGDVYYYLSIVTSAPTSVGGPSDILMLKPNFEVTSDIIEVDAP